MTKTGGEGVRRVREARAQHKLDEFERQVERGERMVESLDARKAAHHAKIEEAYGQLQEIRGLFETALAAKGYKATKSENLDQDGAIGMRMRFDEAGEGGDHVYVGFVAEGGVSIDHFVVQAGKPRHVVGKPFEDIDDALEYVKESIA